jgi:hypothetical protein
MRSASTETRRTTSSGLSSGRHVDDLEEVSGFVQDRDCAMRPRIDSEDGLGSHLHAPFEDREKREVREVREICPAASRHERAGKREEREAAPLDPMFAG